MSFNDFGEILAVVEKYSEVLNKLNADIFIGFRGTNYLCIVNPDYGDYEVLGIFKTAADFEGLIASIVAENIEVSIEAGVDVLNCRIRSGEFSSAVNDSPSENSINELKNILIAISDEYSFRMSEIQKYRELFEKIPQK